MRVGSSLRAPEKRKDVVPVYPAVAQAGGIEGAVILELTIGVDGKVANAKILRSSPLFDRAAIDAVMQWEYAPTLLNGVPVPVIMTTTVTFSLPPQPPPQ